MGAAPTIGVLFVCLGNICRSPMAEAVFRDLVRTSGLEDRFHIDSAGTGGWHAGERPHRGTRAILDAKGISYAGIIARQVTPEDFERFDYIVAMDKENVKDLARMRKSLSVPIVRLLDYVPDNRMGDIPDPYYTGNFEEVYELILEGCRALLEQIRKEREL
jgi:protein-tyrosine phosphatase